jgi:hypothetical protein
MLANELMENECIHIFGIWQCNNDFYDGCFLVACLFLNYMLLNS